MAKELGRGIFPLGSLPDIPRGNNLALLGIYPAP